MHSFAVAIKTMFQGKAKVPGSSALAMWMKVNGEPPGKRAMDRFHFDEPARH